MGLCALLGCTSRETLKLHYLTGFVPGTRATLPPINLAVAPIAGELASGTHEVGHIYTSSGLIQKTLSVSNSGAMVHDALMIGLADAGLKPIALDQPIDPKDLPAGTDLMLSCELEQLSVDKNFGAPETIHGQYFTMAARVKLKYTLQRRDGSAIAEGVAVGAEDEPPKPVGAEAFLPLETDPAESLSVAMSRAVGMMLLDAKFRAAFPARSP